MLTAESLSWYKDEEVSGWQSWSQRARIVAPHLSLTHSLIHSFVYSFTDLFIQEMFPEYHCASEVTIRMVTAKAGGCPRYHTLYPSPHCPCGVQPDGGKEDGGEAMVGWK